MLDHTITQGALHGVAGTDQAGAGESGLPEAGDWYGRTLALTDYLDASGSPAALLIIGVPGEDLEATRDTGRIVSISVDGALTELADLDQDDGAVDGVSEAGDRFGWAVTAVNRDPGNVPTWDELLFAVGSPGEDLGESPDAGTVQVFSAFGAPGDHDVTVSEAHLAGTGFARESGQQLGSFVHATESHLFIADPLSTQPAVYGIPWGNLLSGGTQEVLVVEPGAAGLPVDGVGMFGAALA